MEQSRICRVLDDRGLPMQPKTESSGLFTSEAAMSSQWVDRHAVSCHTLSTASERQGDFVQAPNE